MRRYTVFILIFFILIPLVFSRQEKVSFDEKAAMSHIRTLASDEMEGRKSGLPGAARAEEYIASKFREWGLFPAGDNGTFFQNLTMEFRHVEEGVVFRIITDREERNFTYGEDWRVERYSGSGHFTTEVVFAGYGIHAPEKGYDDYAGVDVKDRIVLFSGDTPLRLKDKLKDEARMENRVKAAQRMGARGIMHFREEKGRGRYGRTRLGKAVYKPDFVILSVDKRVADFLFKDLPTEVSYLLRKVNRTSKPASFHTGVKAFVSVNAIFEQARPTRNVLAMIEGTEEELKGECLVIGAHMDHLGIHPTGEVMNGANDNASGTAVVMEVARVLRENRFKPKRTIIFGLWAGEEQGLWGSRHYVEHPVIPLEKTIVYINLDMVGIGRSRIPFQGVYYGPEIWKVLKKKLPSDISGYILPGRGGPSGSDHASFLRKGVPGFYIIQPPLLKYHQSRDDSDLIDPQLLKKTGDFVLQAAEILASDHTDFLQPMREERYQFKYQKLINFRLSSLDEFIEHHIEARDSDVDVQLVVVGEGGAKGDELRVDILKRIIAASEKIRMAGGLTFYSTTQHLSRNVYRGRTTVLPGLDGVSAIADIPEWAQVLAKQGLLFVLIDRNGPLFDERGLREEGKKVLRALNQNGLLVVARGLNPSQAEALLKDSQDPLILLSRQIPDDGILELIRKSRSALGLILGKEDLPSAYFARLEQAKKSLSTDHLLIVNEQCLWGKEAKKQMLGVISEILKAKYERTEISNLFSESFLRILKEVRGEGEQAPVAFIPF